MSFRKFGHNDVIYNTMKAHPRNEFFIYDMKVYYNNRPRQHGAFNPDIYSALTPSGDPVTDPGYVSLYEYNIDKKAGENPYIYAFITKDSARASFKTAGPISETTYDTEFNYGDILTASYPQYASITRDFAPRFATESIPGVYDWDAKMFYSLNNLFNLYGTLSPHYMVSSSYGDKTKQKINLISIPSIFYGKKINPGSLSLRWYYTGSLLAELQDPHQNGELVQVGPPGSEGSGSVAGVVLYNEGFLVLTGAWALSSDTIGLQNRTTASGPAWAPTNGLVEPSWLYFAAGAQDSLNKGTTVIPPVRYCSTSITNASFGLTFEGTTKTQVLTMYAHAKRGEANYSNNPSFLKYGQEQLSFTSSHVYEENSNRLIANTVSSSYNGYTASFERQVYISKIAIYDDNKDLIGVATLANPVLKKEAEDIAIKIKLDI